VSRFVRTIGIAGSCLAISAAGIWVVAGPARAGVALPPAELTPLGGATPSEGFGSSVAISGSTAVVGTAAKVGLAYVFVQSGGKWAQRAKLSAPTCGNDVALSGSTVIVGGSGCRSAYVFAESGGKWTQQATLDPPQIGTTVALAGPTTAFVSGWSSTYVYVESAGVWTNQATLSPAAGPVAASGSTAVGGNSGRTLSAEEAFSQSGGTWIDQGALSAGRFVDDYGISVAISGSTAVVGADLATNDEGRAWVFVRTASGWTRQVILRPSHPVAFDRFGQSVAISGATALIGSSGDDAAYVFDRSGSNWAQRTELTSPDGGNFGQAVALSGSTAIVGSPLSNAAYVFAQIP
jgi:hypothetical protein